MLITSNTGRPFSESPQADHRKEGIAGLLNRETPDIVLFQEFPWVGLETLEEYTQITVPYSVSGLRDACIVYKRNRFTIESQNDINMGDDELAINLREFIQQGRLHMLKITMTSNPLQSFLCVSWHAQKAEALSQLRKMLRIVVKTAQLTHLPFIIAGDFNVSIDSVTAEIENIGLNIYNYEPQERRESKSIIDLFLSSQNLSLTDVQSINWGNLPQDVNTIFDHDPVKATLSLQ